MRGIAILPRATHVEVGQVDSFAGARTPTAALFDGGFVPRYFCLKQHSEREELAPRAVSRMRGQRVHVYGHFIGRGNFHRRR
jgi:hypothetical protein